MAKTITHDDKFHRKFRIGASGDVIDQGSKLDSGIGNLLTVENHLRIVTEGLGVANSIEVRARMLDESSWNTIATITGNDTEIVDITTYEVIHFHVTTYDASEGYLIVTGFVKNAPPGLSESMQLITLVDTSSSDFIYIGSALPSTAKGDAKWRLQRVDIRTSEIEILFAGSSEDFTHVWDNRTGLVYG